MTDKVADVASGLRNNESVFVPEAAGRTREGKGSSRNSTYLRRKLSS